MIAANVNSSNIYRFLNAHGFKEYDALYQWSITDKSGFWRDAIAALDLKFKQPFSAVLDVTRGVERPDWLIDAKLNIVESCFTAPPQQTAIIYQDIDLKLQKISYGDLLSLVNRIANALQQFNFAPGTAIAIDMLLTVEAVAIYLAIIKAGFVAVGIADSFAATEVAHRIAISDAKLIFTQDVIIRAGKELPMYNKLLDAALPPIVVVPQYHKDFELRVGDMLWQDFLLDNTEFAAVIKNPHDAINILFSSGTTGEPKAIVWDHTSAIKSASDGYFYQDIQPSDVVAWPTSLGWMMGPWLIFATLINKACIALDYDVATSRSFTEFVANAQVTILGLVPSIVKAWRNKDLTSGLDWSAVKLFSSTGETSNAADMQYLMQTAGGKPIIEYCGGTEISGAYITSTLLQENIAATFSTPTLGLELKLIDENGNYVDQGEVALVPPSLGLSRVLLNRDNFQEYYAVMPRGKDGKILRKHGDQMQRLANGYYKSLGRADDAMNLGGIKVSAAEIEQCLLDIPDVLEAVAIGKNNLSGLTELIIYVVAAPTKVLDLTQLQQTMQQAINKKLNPLFKINAVRLIDAIPRTSSNKIMRRLLRDLD